jgi:hypothetical protein
MSYAVTTRFYRLCGFPHAERSSCVPGAISINNRASPSWAPRRRSGGVTVDSTVTTRTFKGEL